VQSGELMLSGRIDEDALLPLSSGKIDEILSWDKDRLRERICVS
jgi:hypothetical protein